jgi:putative flippase GtrA
MVSGGVAFVVDASLLYILTEWLGLHYLLSTLLSYSVGLLITYAFSILWVFDYRSVESRALEFSVFAVIGVMGLGLTSLCMWLFTSGLGFHYLWSKIITTIIVFVWNFIMKKFLLFRRRKKDE